LLLENIHKAAVEALESEGYSIETSPNSMSEDELIERIKGVDVLGIRSKTKITAKVIEAADKLLGIGCFGIGTNQVDLKAATSAAIAVFNAPYGSTRSVAELAVAGILNLARRAGDANLNMHAGRWEKSAKGAHEIRGKVIGIVGYGHIG
jgi:D-3-phosphoglycerate dehydrogenase